MVNRRTSPSSKIPQEKIQGLIDLYDQGAFEEVLSKVERLIELFPKEALLFNIRGVALRNIGDLEAAIVSYKHAISIQPGYAEPYLNIGYVLSNKGDLDEAIDSFVAGYFNTTVALTRFQFKMSSGNIDSGIIKLYGVT